MRHTIPPAKALRTAITFGHLPDLAARRELTQASCRDARATRRSPWACSGSGA
ncbi:hypothetical protein WMF38_49275 [Sorangium sp. So ce118]